MCADSVMAMFLLETSCNWSVNVTNALAGVAPLPSAAGGAPGGTVTNVLSTVRVVVTCAIAIAATTSATRPQNSILCAPPRGVGAFAAMSVTGGRPTGAPSNARSTSCRVISVDSDQLTSLSASSLDSIAGGATYDGVKFRLY